MKSLESLTQMDLVAVVIIIIAFVSLIFLTKLIIKGLIKYEHRIFPTETPRIANLVKKVLNLLWLVLGCIALVFVFANKEHYKILIANFKLASYLGILTVLTITLASIANLWFKKSIAKKLLQNEDPTSFKFLRYVAVFGIYFIGSVFFLMAFPSLRGIAQTALGGAGVLAIIAGIASQEALANIVGGIFIISFKPFKVGDIIMVTDTMIGTVEDITLRHTVIRNFENKMIVIPNSVINKERLINYDLGEKKCCERVEIGISYDSDVTLAKKIMQEECEKHPLIYDNRTEKAKKQGEPLVKTALLSLNDFSVTIRAWAWAKDFQDAFQLRIDVYESIKKRFENEGIEIPYPYRTVIMRQEQAKNK